MQKFCVARNSIVGVRVQTGVDEIFNVLNKFPRQQSVENRTVTNCYRQTIGSADEKGRIRKRTTLYSSARKQRKRYEIRLTLGANEQEEITKYDDRGARFGNYYEKKRITYRSSELPLDFLTRIRRLRLLPGYPVKRHQHPRYADFFVVTPHRFYNDASYLLGRLHVQQERKSISRFLHQSRIHHYRVNRSEFYFGFFILCISNP